jgi:nitronate monooxygenase
MSESSEPNSQKARIHTRLTERFNIAHPIVCAPMGLVTGGALAAAVSRAGGLGIVGGGYAGTLGGEPDLESELAQASSEKVGVGFITWALAKAPDVVSNALRYSPFCVFLSFGDPRPFAAPIRDSGALLICQIQFLSQIDMALEAGAIAVVAQGTEAGGHAASRSTLPFVPEAADYLKQHSPETLLLAAGGIADGRGLAAALMLGADGVVVGSRFWSSAEALTPKPHTDKASTATGDSTIRTRTLDALRGTPWPNEYSFRFLNNQLATEWHNREAEAFRAFGTLSAQYAQARAQNDLDTVAVVCGEGVGLFNDRPPAASIVRSMINQAAELFRRGATLSFM